MDRQRYAEWVVICQKRGGGKSGCKGMSVQQSIERVSEYYRPLTQEYISGIVYDAPYDYHNGKLVASPTQFREITSPLSCGPKVQNVTVRIAVFMIMERSY